MTTDIEEQECIIRAPIQDILGLCGGSNRTITYLEEYMGECKKQTIDLWSDGDQIEAIDRFKYLISSTWRDHGYRAYIVALRTGGEMGNPEIKTECPYLVFASNAKNAMKVYDRVEETSYYKASIITQVEFTK